MTILISFKRKLDSITSKYDIYDAFRPLYRTCKLFGLSPYSEIKFNGEKFYKVTTFSVISTISYIVFYSTLLYLSIYHSMTMISTVTDLGINFQAQILQEIMACVLSVMEVVFSLIFSRSLVSIFLNIHNVDEEFKKLGIWVLNRTIYIRVLISLAVTVLIIFSFIVSFPLIYQWSTEIILTIFYSLISYLPYLTNILVCISYVNYMKVLKERYAILNDYLETLATEVKRANVSSVNVYKRSFPHVGNDKISKSFNAILDPIYVIDTVVSLHIKLSDTAVLINHAFAVQLLLLITIAFIGIVCALFSMAFNLGRNDATDDGFEWNVLFIIWVSTNIVELLAVVFATSSLCEEVKNCTLFVICQYAI